MVHASVRTITRLCIAALSIVLAGCQTVSVWVGAEEDAYISCGPPGPAGSCPEQNLNFGRHSQLVVAQWDLARKRSFVRFRVPTFPPGGAIVSAHVEMFHEGVREDGQRDDIRIRFDTPPPPPWVATTLTWANSPINQALGGPNCIQLVSKAWSASNDIAAQLVPGTFYEMYVNTLEPPAIEKAFASNNHSSRTATNLGIGPRLLMRVRVFFWAQLAASVTRSFPPSHDLGRLAQPVLMEMSSPSANWPASWTVTGPFAFACP
jgi:hypothetical protein